MFNWLCSCWVVKVGPWWSINLLTGVTEFFQQVLYRHQKLAIDREWHSDSTSVIPCFCPKAGILSMRTEEILLHGLRATFLSVQASGQP